MVNSNGDVYAYSVWVHEAQLNLYFERGMVKSFLPLGVEEYAGNSIQGEGLTVAPSIGSRVCCASFELHHPGAVVLDLYDASGRFVTRLHDGYLKSGKHRISINTNVLANGLYFAVLEIPGGRQTAKFVIAK